MTAKPIPEVRREFWQFYAAQDPDVATRPYQDSNNWFPMTEDGLVILSLGIQQDGSSVFLRGKLDAGRDTARPILEPHRASLDKALLVNFEADGDIGQGRYYRKRTKACFTQPRDWPEIARWFRACRLRYAAVLAATLKVST